MGTDTDSEVALNMQVACPPVAPIRLRIRWMVVAATALFLALAAQAPASRISDPVLARTAAHHPARQVEVIVQFSANVSEAQARRAVRAVHGRVGAVVPVINGLSARMSARAARRLAHRAGVRAVSLNSRVKAQAKDVPDPKKLYTSFVQSSGLEPTWAKTTGAGVGVAVIDTGIAGDLPDFRVSETDPTSRVIASVVTNPDATTANDVFGHGTHVAGLIAGNSLGRGKSDRSYGKFAGTAPKANLISIKAGDDQGNATVLDVIYGLQFAIDHKADYNIRVVNLSLESSSAESYKTDPLDAAAEAAWFSGIVVVAAAGNRGSAPDAVQYAPGNDPYVISVGAIDDAGSKGNGDDLIADWSSRGTTQDGFVKPDVYAPGAHIFSTLAPGSAFASMCPSCIFEGNYIQAGGTSMSAPIVSGVVADMLALHPDWTPDMVKGAVTGTLRDVDTSGALKRSFDAQQDAAKKAFDAQRPTKDAADAFRKQQEADKKAWDAQKAARRMGELDGDHGITADPKKLVPANQGLTPNEMIVDPATGAADLTRSRWSRSRWSRSRWSQATGDLSAGWARSSWSCTCSRTESGAVDPTRSRWSRSSWSTVLGL